MLRLPFLNRGGDDRPLRLPLPPMLHHDTAIYVRTPSGAPPEQEVAAHIADWIERRAAEPLRQGLRAYCEGPFFQLIVDPRSAAPEPPVELLRAWRPGELEERRFHEAGAVVLVRAVDLPGKPPIGLWVGIAASRAIAEAYGGVVLDPLYPRLLPLDRLEEGIPGDGRLRLADHVMVPSSVNERGLGWVTTKGLARFGLPELEIRDVPQHLIQSVAYLAMGAGQVLLRRMFERLAEREEPAKELVLDPTLRVEIADIAKAYREEEPLGEGARGWTEIGLRFRKGGRNEDAFLTLVPPPGVKVAHGPWLASVISDLYGTENTMVGVKDDSEAMEAAHRRAVAELPEVRRRFQAGLGVGDELMVKHGFPTDDEKHEYMWIVVAEWKGDRLRGHLANTPQIRLDLRNGQTVEIREHEVFDWYLTRQNGPPEGGYTNRVVESERRR